MENYFDVTNPGSWAVILSALALFYVLGLIIINRYGKPENTAKILNIPQNLPNQLGNSLTLTVWNIGYAGLGKDSDFVMDGGKSWFPPSRTAVKQNLSGILSELTALKSVQKSNILLLQEVSKNSPLSFWQPVRRSIIKNSPDYFALFRSDISSRGLPWPLAIKHGTMTLSDTTPQSTKVIDLPAEPTFIMKLVKRNYALLVTRFAINNSAHQWVIINLHLAAFDPKGETRFKQFDALFAFAKSEFEQGNYVILGGDWNMALTNSDFAHKTDISKLFWLVDFPQEKLPPGWQVAYDPDTPTVRTNYQPFIKGQNYTTIIDGFIVSPNVNTDQVKTTNTEFTHTDHMPVTASFSTKPSG